MFVTRGGRGGRGRGRDNGRGSGIANIWMDASRACVHGKVNYTVAEVHTGGLIATSAATPHVQKMSRGPKMAAAGEKIEFTIESMLRLTHRANPRPSFEDYDCKSRCSDDDNEHSDEDSDFEDDSRVMHERERDSQVLITKVSGSRNLDTTILLDSCASNSIFREGRLLGDIRDADVHLSMKGIFGKAVICDRTGDHHDLGTIYLLSPWGRSYIIFFVERTLAQQDR